MRKKFLHAILFLILGGCIEEFNVPPMEHKPRLVVDALITDQEGPHTVDLTYSAALSNYYSNRTFVGGAIVRIIDNQNDTIQLTETSQGRYQTFPASWKLVVGNKYRLYIRLADGREYESDFQEVNPAGVIEKLSAKILYNSINNGNPSEPQHSFGIYIDSRGVSQSSNLFRWRAKGIFEIKTHPEQRTIMDPFCGCPVSSPPPCALGICSCCTCWVTEYDRTVYVSNNKFVNTSEFKGVEVMRVPVDNFRFFSKYYVEVEQISLSESAYNFWRLIQAQQEGATNLFQPNVVRIRGNVRSLSDSSEEVFGVVSFSASHKQSLFVYRSMVPYSLPPIPVITDDCRLVFKNSSNERPSFW